MALDNSLSWLFVAMICFMLLFIAVAAVVNLVARVLINW